MLYLFLQLWEIMINGVEAFLYYLLVKKKMKAKEMPYRSQKITLFLCCQVALLYVFNHFGVSTLITIGFFVCMSIDLVHNYFYFHLKLLFCVKEKMHYLLHVITPFCPIINFIITSDFFLSNTMLFYITLCFL